MGKKTVVRENTYEVLTVPLAACLVFFLFCAFQFLFFTYELFELSAIVGAAFVVVSAVLLLSSGSFSYHVERKTIMHNQSTSGKHHQPQQLPQLPTQPTAMIEAEIIDAEYSEMPPPPATVHQLTHDKPKFKQFRKQRSKQHA